MAKKLTPIEQMDYINHGNYYRGTVINSFTTLERTIEQILTSHFITNKKKINDFVYIILDRMTFESKRTSLKALNEKREKFKGFMKTKNNRYPNSKIFEEIRLLQEERNQFAHFTIMIPIEETNYVIGLAYLRDGFVPKWYTLEDIENLNNRIAEATNKIRDLFNI